MSRQSPLLKILNPGQIQSENSERNIRPHVLLVVDQLPKVFGGGERIVLKLVSLLPQYGYRVSVITFSAHEEVYPTFPCPLYLLPLERTYDYKALQGAFEFRRLLDRQKICIAQTFFESSDLWAGFVTKNLSSAKLIWSRRDMGILRTGKHHLAYKFMAAMPDKVFAVSELVRRHCIDVDGIAPDKVQTIYNGLDLEGWGESAHSNKSDHILITTIGNIRRVKGHDIFIHAAASVVKFFPGAQFSIAGEILDFQYFAELQSLIRNLNLTSKFHFVGGISDLRKHLLPATTFVLPSRSEGFSNAIIEAMAASLPVIATDVGGNAEAVSDGINGFIVPPENPEALGSAIRRMLSQPMQAKKMGMKGREIVVKKFTTAVMMESITQTYHNLLT